VPQPAGWGHFRQVPVGVVIVAHGPAVRRRLLHHSVGRIVGEGAGPGQRVNHAVQPAPGNDTAVPNRASPKRVTFVRVPSGVRVLSIPLGGRQMDRLFHERNTATLDSKMGQRAFTGPYR